MLVIMIIMIFIVTFCGQGVGPVSILLCLFLLIIFSSDDLISILFLFFDDFDDHDHLQRHHCAGKVSGRLMNEQVLSINRSACPVGPHAKQPLLH